MSRGDIRVTVVGAGGTIGSQLVHHLVRINAVCELRLVDRDRYEPRNVWHQAVDARAVGRPKVEVLAERARRFDPDLRVVPLHHDVEELPLGWFGADVLITCPDNRRARQIAIASAWRMGTPIVLDGGVRGKDLLVRLSCFPPGDAVPCYECGWGDDEYAALDLAPLCAEPRTVATDAPSALGATAAALIALELEAQLDGSATAMAAGEERVVNLAHHVIVSSRRARSRECRFDHRRWPRAVPVSGTSTLRQLLGLAAPPTNRTRSIEIGNGSFRRTALCAGCGTQSRVLVTRDGAGLAPCRCGGARRSTPFGASALIDADELTPSELDRRLCQLGLRPRDVLAVEGCGDEGFAVEVVGEAA